MLLAVVQVYRPALRRAGSTDRRYSGLVCIVDLERLPCLYPTTKVASRGSKSCPGFITPSPRQISCLIHSRAPRFTSRTSTI